MRTSSTAKALSVLAVALVSAQSPKTGDLGNATVVENNPPGVVYQATLPADAFTKSAYPNGGNVQGSIQAVASPNGIGVMFKVRFSNLPKEGGPFPYHIHVAPVPDGGNCTATLAHLDPYVRGEDPTCDKNLPQTCQVGDLSGKHGAITSDPFEATYVDWFASSVDGLGAYFGNRSFVVHFANKTRISCANFVKVNDVSPSDFTTAGACAPTTTLSSGTSTATATRNLTTTFTSTTATSRPTGSTVSVSSANSLRAVSAVLGPAALAAALAFML